MKKIFTLFILMLCLIPFSSCELSINFDETTEVDDTIDSGDTTEVVDSTDTDDTTNPKDDSSDKDSKTKHTHTIVIDDAVEPTCTTTGLSEGSHCSICGEIITAQEEIPALGHDLVVDAAVEATKTTTGLTEGSHCKRCGEIIVAQTTIPLVSKYDKVIDKTTSDIPYKLMYDSSTYDYKIYDKDGLDLTSYTVYASNKMFESLKSQENASNILNAYLNIVSESLIITLYDEYDNTSVKANVQVDGETTLKTFYYTSKVNYTDYGITADEAKMLWTSIESDFPLFYWLSNAYIPGTKDFYFIIEDEYITYSSRENINNKVFDTISDINSKVESYTELKKIKYVYDYVLGNTNYAWVVENVTPSDELDAHAISGFFNGENVVCEGYAKSLQIIYNYLGIDNCYITGTAGDSSSSGGHAWNYVKYNNEWYFMDSTWDDSNSSVGAITSYTWYLLSQSELDSETSYFHTASTETSGIDYQYTLPTLSTTTISKKKKLF